MERGIDELVGQLVEVGTVSYYADVEMSCGRGKTLSEDRMAGFIDGISTACTAFAQIARGDVPYPGAIAFIERMSSFYLYTALAHPEKFAG
jgi:hypothetical protein